MLSGRHYSNNHFGSNSWFITPSLWHLAYKYVGHLTVAWSAAGVVNSILLIFSFTKYQPRCSWTQRSLHISPSVLYAGYCTYFEDKRASLDVWSTGVWTDRTSVLRGVTRDHAWTRDQKKQKINTLLFLRDMRWRKMMLHRLACTRWHYESRERRKEERKTNPFEMPWLHRAVA